MSSKFPVRIHRLDTNGVPRFAAAAPMEQVLLHPTESERLLDSVGIDYDLTIAAGKLVLERLNGKRRKDPRLYWHLACLLDGFLKRLRDHGFYLVNQNDTFGRDLGTSGSSLEKLLMFYRRFPSSHDLDPDVPWQRYRDNKVAPEIPKVAAP